MDNKYGLVLSLHFIIIGADLCFNVASTIFFHENTVQLMLFILQDTLIVMAIIITAIMFSSTYVFQAGLISVLLTKFSTTILMLLIYLALSINLHVFSLRERWKTTDRYLWSTHVVVLYVLQRISAILYYYLYKRTVLHLSDPKYRFDSEWLWEKIRQRS